MLFENIKNDLKEYNKISLYILKFGTVILIILSVIAIIIKLILLLSADSIPLEFFYSDLLECIKEAFGSIYFGAFLLEFLHLMIKNTAVN